MIKFPNLGLWGAFAPCEQGILPALNDNFLLLDVLVQSNFIDFVADEESLPSTPTEGDVYILNYTKEIAFYEDDGWQLIESQEGWFFQNKTTDLLYYFNGTTWVRYDENFVKHPATSTDNALVRFDGTTGKLVQNSTAILTDDGDLTLRSIHSASQAISSITGANQTLPLVNSLHAYITSAVTSISDLTNPTDATKDYFFSVTNQTGGDLVYNNNTRILTGLGKPLKVKNNGSVWFRYSSVDDKFYIIGGAGGGGSGGGSGIEWQSNILNGAIKDIETVWTNTDVFLFPLTLSDSVVACYKVPKLHDAGTQKRMIIQVLAGTAAFTSKKFKFQCDVALAKQGSGTLQNRSVTVEIGPITSAGAPVLYNLDFDITDSNGQINSVNVEANDCLFLNLYRIAASSDEFSDTVKLLTYNTEVYDV